MDSDGVRVCQGRAFRCRPSPLGAISRRFPETDLGGGGNRVIKDPWKAAKRNARQVSLVIQKLQGHPGFSQAALSRRFTGSGHVRLAGLGA